MKLGLRLTTSRESVHPNVLYWLDKVWLELVWHVFVYLKSNVREMIDFTIWDIIVIY